MLSFAALNLFELATASPAKICLATNSISFIYHVGSQWSLV